MRKLILILMITFLNSTYASEKRLEIECSGNSYGVLRNGEISRYSNKEVFYISEKNSIEFGIATCFSSYCGGPFFYPDARLYFKNGKVYFGRYSQDHWVDKTIVSFDFRFEFRRYDYDGSERINPPMCRAFLY